MIKADRRFATRKPTQNMRCQRDCQGRWLYVLGSVEARLEGSGCWSVSCQRFDTQAMGRLCRQEPLAILKRHRPVLTHAIHGIHLPAMAEIIGSRS